MSSLTESLSRLRSRMDGHDTPFTVLDASYVWAELVRLRALAADRPAAGAGDDTALVATMTRVIELHHPSPDHVLGQLPAEDLARELLPVVRGATAAVPAPPDAETETRTEYRVMADGLPVSTNGTQEDASNIADRCIRNGLPNVHVESRQVTTTTTRTAWTETSTTNQPEESPDA